MNFHHDKFYNTVSDGILRLLNACKERLDNESIASVVHFLEHGEYELAFEGLLIELMARN